MSIKDNQADDLEKQYDKSSQKPKRSTPGFSRERKRLEQVGYYQSPKKPKLKLKNKIKK